MPLLFSGMSSLIPVIVSWGLTAESPVPQSRPSVGEQALHNEGRGQGALSLVPLAALCLWLTGSLDGFWCKRSDLGFVSGCPLVLRNVNEPFSVEEFCELRDICWENHLEDPVCEASQEPWVRGVSLPIAAARVPVVTRECGVGEASSKFVA